MKNLRTIQSLFLMLCVTTACSTAKPTSSHAPNAVASSSETSFEIVYSLGGHGGHRLTGSSGAGPSSEARVATYHEWEIVDEALVRRESYEHFLGKLMSFAQKPQRIPSEEHDCRSPYSVTVKIAGKTTTSKGCRFEDDGAFAKIVREGEFLLYSKK